VILLSAIFNTFMVSSDIARVIGLLLFGIGTLLFIIAMFTMKDSWRAGIPSEEKTAFVTRGIYQYSRNPAFLGFDLTYIGAILAFGNIILLILAVFTITMMHLQILEEEHFLETRFGNDYTIYKSKVRRYI
jgi:protein-S-isoprenylcysteine O-methyltransferase Ste14